MWPFYRRMYLIGFILVGISSFVNFFGDVFVNRFYINLLRGEDGAFFNFMASCVKYRHEIEMCGALGFAAVYMRYADYIYLKYANLKNSKGVSNRVPNIICGAIGLFFSVVSIFIAFEVIKFFALKPLTT